MEKNMEYVVQAISNFWEIWCTLRGARDVHKLHFGRHPLFKLNFLA